MTNPPRGGKNMQARRLTEREEAGAHGASPPPTRRPDVRHNLAYQTIHKPTGRYYLGIHSTDDLDDGYLGSGAEFRRFRKGKPRSDFHRHIVRDFATRAEACEWEAATVTMAVVNDPRSLNRQTGGGNAGTPGPQQKRLLRDAANAQWADPHAKAEASARAKAQMADPAAKRAAADRMRKRMAKPGAREAHSKNQKRRMQDPVYKERMAAAKRGRKLDAAHCFNISRANGTPVEVGDQVFVSIRKASAETGVPVSTLRRWVKAGKHGAKRLDKDDPRL